MEIREKAIKRLKQATYLKYLLLISLACSGLVFLYVNTLAGLVMFLACIIYAIFLLEYKNDVRYFKLLERFDKK